MRRKIFSSFGTAFAFGLLATAAHAEVTLPEDCPDWQRALLTDPQTSGGLLVAVAPEAAEGWVRRLREAGYPLASVVGRVEEGEGVAVI